METETEKALMMKARETRPLSYVQKQPFAPQMDLGVTYLRALMPDATPIGA